MQIGGGLGDEYMRAPILNVGGGGSKGHGSFIANLLDLLGVNHQVAKEPKGEKGDKGVGNATAAAASGKQVKAPTASSQQAAATAAIPSSPMAAPPPAGLTILDDAHAAFSPMTPRASKFGMGLTMLPNALR